MIKRLLNSTKKKGQLELDIKRAPEPDRNFEKGGRSFYFFDFDENIAYLSTPTYVFHKDTHKELELPSQMFAESSELIGKSGPYKNYYLDFDEEKGSFRNFRDKDIGLLRRVLGAKQPFYSDLRGALKQVDLHWKGPSWSCFYHAVFNQRPISLITARGHHPNTLKKGIQLFVRAGYLPSEPNYLSIYPVNNPKTKEALSGGKGKSVAELKQAAIRSSVEQAISQYGYSPFHRFGMSDDDPQNIRLIIEEMAELKKTYSELSFFVIETHKGQFIKHEVFNGYTKDQFVDKADQLSII